MKNLAQRVASACVLCSLLLIGLGPAAMAQSKGRKQKYNVLFIIADDLRTELGAYGVEGITTLRPGTLMKALSGCCEW